MPFLGNSNTNEFHDLDRVRPQCQIDEIRASHHDVTFLPDTMEQAVLEGFEPCAYCIGTTTSLLASLLRPVPAPYGMRARVRETESGAPSEIELSWDHAGPVALGKVSFDVFASTDPARMFRSPAVTSVPARSAVITSFAPGDEVHLAVIARRGGGQSTPSDLVKVRLPPGVAPLPTPPGRRLALLGPPAGLRFPFGIGEGRVRADGGDDHVRGKILQLLLTVPGERVNRPDYGTRLRDLVFDPNDVVLAATTELTVTAALQRFMADDLDVTTVQVRAVESELHVDIQYVRRRDLSADQLRIRLPTTGVPLG